MSPVGTLPHSLRALDISNGQCALTILIDGFGILDRTAKLSGALNEPFATPAVLMFAASILMRNAAPALVAANETVGEAGEVLVARVSF